MVDINKNSWHYRFLYWDRVTQGKDYSDMFDRKYSTVCSYYRALVVSMLRVIFIGILAMISLLIAMIGLVVLTYAAGVLIYGGGYPIFVILAHVSGYVFPYDEGLYLLGWAFLIVVTFIVLWHRYAGAIMKKLKGVKLDARPSSESSGTSGLGLMVNFFSDLHHKVCTKIEFKG